MSHDNTIYDHIETFNLNKNPCVIKENLQPISDDSNCDSNYTSNNDLCCKESNKFYFSNKQIIGRNKIDSFKNRLDFHLAPRKTKSKRFNTTKLKRFYPILYKQMRRKDNNFIQEIKKIVEFFDKIGINFRNFNFRGRENPISLLKSLLKKDNLKSKNKILNRIDYILLKLEINSIRS